MYPNTVGHAKEQARALASATSSLLGHGRASGFSHTTLMPCSKKHFERRSGRCWERDAHEAMPSGARFPSRHLLIGPEHREGSRRSSRRSGVLLAFLAEAPALARRADQMRWPCGARRRKTRQLAAHHAVVMRFTSAHPRFPQLVIPPRSFVGEPPSPEAEALSSAAPCAPLSFEKIIQD